MTLTELFTSIADTIRGRNQYAPEKIRAYDFPSEIENACNESEMLGWNIGMEQGLEEGIEEGKQQGRQAQYDEFWDALQNNGKGEDYEQRFFNFPSSIFNPKYDFIFNAYYSASATFRKTTMKDMIKNCDFTALPESNYGLMYTFLGAIKLVNARTLKVRPDLKYSRVFDECVKLEEIRFEGSIGQNGLSFAPCPKLSVESLRSILTALSKDTTYATGKTITFNTASKSVIEADSECSTQLASAVSAGWTVAYNS